MPVLFLSERDISDLFEYRSPAQVSGGCLREYDFTLCFSDSDLFRLLPRICPACAGVRSANSPAFFLRVHAISSHARLTALATFSRFISLDTLDDYGKNIMEAEMSDYSSPVGTPGAHWIERFPSLVDFFLERDPHLVFDTVLPRRFYTEDPNQHAVCGMVIRKATTVYACIDAVIPARALHGLVFEYMFRPGCLFARAVLTAIEAARRALQKEDGLGVKVTSTVDLRC